MADPCHIYGAARSGSARRLKRKAETIAASVRQEFSTDLADDHVGVDAHVKAMQRLTSFGLPVTAENYLAMLIVDEQENEDEDEDGLLPAHVQGDVVHKLVSDRLPLDHTEGDYVAEMVRTSRELGFTLDDYDAR